MKTEIVITLCAVVAASTLSCIHRDLITNPTDSGCPDKQYQCSDYCLEFKKEIEKKIIDYVNEERNAYGCASLKSDPDLSNIARAHSEDMAQTGFFSHINQQGENPTDRARRYGYPLHKELGDGYYSEGIGENIGMMATGDIIGIGYVPNNPDSIAKAQVQAWMNNPEHKENILNETYQNSGVGTAYDGDYYLSTQTFW
ncbi:CAP domain-containing protein [Candidatus Woesearchaeota archaeon]|nr:CAP domain-containing protein [Candidatus Woesearchaeota archaeon]